MNPGVDAAPPTSAFPGAPNFSSWSMASSVDYFGSKCKSAPRLAKWYVTKQDGLN